MLRPLFIILICACVQILSAQEFQTTFFGETQGGDYLPGYISGLPDGGAYIVGQTNRGSSGGYHVLLIRTDAQGARLWERSYHAGTGTWVATTPDGGCVLGGYSLRHLFGTEQGFVTKIDAQGEPVWTQYFPQGNHSEIREVKPMANGGYAVCGIVSQPDSTGQNVFWAILSESGSLMMYVEIAEVGVEFNPSIMETSSAQLVLCWERNGGDMIQCYHPNGTLNWEQNVLDWEFLSVTPGAIQDAMGDLWVTGMYKYGIGSPANYFILRMDVQNGSLKQQIPTVFQSLTGRPIPGRLEPDNTLVFCTKYTNALVCIRFDEQGIELGRDSVSQLDFNNYRTVDLSAPNKILFLRQEYLFSNPGKISVQPMTFNSSTLTLEPKWELTVDNPFNHDLFEAKAAANNGETFVLFRGKPQNGISDSSGLYIMKHEPDAQIAGPVFLCNQPGIFSLSGQLQATKDGGVIVHTEEDETWKIDQDLSIKWTKQTTNGKLFVGAGNDYFIVESKTQPDPFEPILVHHFHADGQLDKTLEVFSGGQTYYVAGGVSQLNNGPVLFGVKFDETGEPRNWIIYIDRDGNLTSEQLLPELDNLLSSSAKNKFIQTSDGGALAASRIGSKIYMLKVKDGKVRWEATFANGNPEESTMQLLDIEEVPCQGYVLSVLANAFQANTPKIIPESSQIILLYHLDEHGRGQKTFSYRPLPEPSSPNTDFIPGYTYRRWGDLLNGQTYDLLLETVHFPDSLAIQHPAAELLVAPNPSANETCLEYHSDDYGVMEIQVFNEAGQLTDHFFSRKTAAIWHQPYRYRGPSGTYIIRTRLNGQDFISRRLVKAY
ncbi:MAG: T9SS type A sorting domain-containing protein [Saprospiraceae bacterium]|nr:T9SS type A sorting domain-containing protein [Saprospiraceae bacterium]